MIIIKIIRTIIIVTCIIIIIRVLKPKNDILEWIFSTICYLYKYKYIFETFRNAIGMKGFLDEFSAVSDRMYIV